MNIGKWIIVAFILFAAFIATLVTVCMKQDISLVSKDYYQQELAYQEQIMRINNTNSLPVKPSIQANNGILSVQLDSTYLVDEGNIKLFCPSNAAMDRIFKLNAHSSLNSQYDLTGLQRGMYRVKLHWTMRGKEYYQEEVISL